VDSLAALGAWLRGRSERLALDPAVTVQLERVVDLLGVATAAPPPRQAMALGMIRAFFRQAADLLDAPERAPGWTYDDPVVLQAQGRGSISVAEAIAAAAPTLADLDARLRSPGGTFLDVGTGVGWLALGLAERYPTLAVTGLDRFAPELALARSNLVAHPDGGRVELRTADVVELTDSGAFDAAWLPGPFLAATVLPTAVTRVAHALRPGGWLLLGLYGGAEEDALALALADLRAVRSGGHPWSAAEATALLARAGLGEVHEVPT